MSPGDILSLKKLEREVDALEKKHGLPVTWTFFHQKVIIAFRNKYRIIAHYQNRRFEIRNVGFPKYLKRK